MAVDEDRAAKVGRDQAVVEAAMADLVAGLGQPGEASQPSLMLDDMDEQMALFSGPVKHVADTIAGSRGRGRPRGSQNKSGFRDTLLRMGFRHPGLNLAAMANADPYELAVELGALAPIDGVAGLERLQLAMSRDGLKRDQVIALLRSAQELIGKANAELMPYFESKRPTEIETTIRQLGVMVINDVRGERGPDAKFMDVAGIDDRSK